MAMARGTSPGKGYYAKDLSTTAGDRDDLPKQAFHASDNRADLPFNDNETCLRF